MVLQNKHKQIASRRYQRRHQQTTGDEGHDDRAELDAARVSAVQDQPNRYIEDLEADQWDLTKPASPHADKSADTGGASEREPNEPAEEHDARDQSTGVAQDEEEQTAEDQEQQRAVDELVQKHAQSSRQSMFDNSQGVDGVVDDVDEDFSFLKARSSVGQRTIHRVARPEDDGSRRTEMEVAAARRLAAKQNGPRRLGTATQTGTRRHDAWIDGLMH
ncbi:hypothetical protein OIV83_004806 [Microbotryomycetes sp. JL201]|nr:hypothetical protein OIV83_004806 [Microbotryomycetes sp. JL201]